MSDAKKDPTIEEVVRAAVQAAMQGMGGILKDVALTPDKINELKKPYVDSALEARNARLREENRREYFEGLERTRLKQTNCAHKDKNNNYAISLVHNFPDRLTRGVCMKCEKWFEPEHYDVDSRGKAVMVGEDAQYHIIRFLESTNQIG